MNKKVLAHIDRAYSMVERAGCFLTAEAITRGTLSPEYTRAVYARTLEAQRALIRAMREMNT